MRNLIIAFVVGVTALVADQQRWVKLQHPGGGGGGGGSALTASDVSFVGYIRMPNTVADTSFAYGGMTGRVVGGKLHFFVYGSITGGFGTTIASGSSTTVFTLGSGQGAGYANGDKVAIVRAAAQPALSEYVTISNVSTDTLTVTPALGGTPASGDHITRNSSLVYEIIDPAASTCGTGAYTTSVATAPRACNYAAWGDIYHGRMMTWDDSATNIYGMNWPGTNWIPTTLTWNETTGMLYSCATESYVISHEYSCLGATLDNVGTLTSTAYGPWKMTAEDGDGFVAHGNPANGWWAAGPSGELLLEGAFYQQNGWPAGPNLHSVTSCTTCTNGWPTTSTPGGPGSTVLTYDTRWLHYYNMNTGHASGNYWNEDASLHGTFRGYPSAYKPILFEPPPLGEGNPRIDGDPDTNPYWGWAEVDGVGGCLWVPGSNKSGMFCAVSRAGSFSSSTSCTTDPTMSGSHHWYVSNGAPCNHGCDMFDDFGIAVTGPGANAMWTGFAIYDEADLEAVRDANGVGDYSVVPHSIMDVTESPYNVQMHTKSIQGKDMRVGYYDASRHYLFAIANQIDDSIPGALTSLIYVFEVNDDPAPTSLASMAYGWPLIALFGSVLALGPLSRKRS